MHSYYLPIVIWNYNENFVNCHENGYLSVTKCVYGDKAIMPI